MSLFHILLLSNVVNYTGKAVFIDVILVFPRARKKIESLPGK